MKKESEVLITFDRGQRRKMLRDGNEYFPEINCWYCHERFVMNPGTVMHNPMCPECIKKGVHKNVSK